MIFYRNPRKGFVKTRLAATIGDDKALEVFMKLALHTREITVPLSVDKMVLYSESIEDRDIWPSPDFQKATQSGADLGERMHNAFASAFGMKYDAVCVIGTDSYDLTTEIIEKAFGYLRSADIVIGPAHDGGYYLLGMRHLYPELFLNKRWSTDAVLNDTIKDIELLRLNYLKLEILNDVDNEDDLPEDWVYSQ